MEEGDSGKMDVDQVAEERKNLIKKRLRGNQIAKLGEKIEVLVVGNGSFFWKLVGLVIYSQGMCSQKSKPRFPPALNFR
jgi:hypothetical protein